MLLLLFILLFGDAPKQEGKAKGTNGKINETVKMVLKIGPFEVFEVDCGIICLLSQETNSGGKKILLFCLDHEVVGTSSDLRTENERIFLHSSPSDADG